MQGTELAYEWPSCNIPGFDYRTFYDHWTCPRVLMQVADYGHCHILDSELQEICSLICVSDLTLDLGAYHDYIQGLAVAFMNAYVGGFMTHLDYVIDPAKIPITLLEHEYDVVC
ncbi:uncharacterized protein LOC144362379 [Saccoglossus kowalevskii]